MKATKEEIANQIAFLKGKEYDSDVTVSCWENYAPKMLDSDMNAKELSLSENEETLKRLRSNSGFKFISEKLPNDIYRIKKISEDAKEDLKMLQYVGWLSVFNGCWMKYENSYIYQSEVEYEDEYRVAVFVKYEMSYRNGRVVLDSRIALNKLSSIKDFVLSSYDVVTDERTIKLLNEIRNAKNSLDRTEKEFKKAIDNFKKNQ